MTENPTQIISEKIACPFCGSENNRLTRKKPIQYLCKNCKKYFSPNVKNNEYSVPVTRLLKILFQLFNPNKLVQEMYIREFYKLSKTVELPEFKMAKIIFSKLNDNYNRRRGLPQIDRRDYSLEDIVILAKKDNKFEVISDLHNCDRITLNGYSIVINKQGNSRNSFY